jgi:hypothetical protein
MPLISWDPVVEATYQLWIGHGADLLEAIAVALIIGYILIATLEWLVRSLLQRRFTIEIERRWPRAPNPSRVSA